MGEIKYHVLSYDSKIESRSSYDSLTPEEKLTMAGTYQDAFGGPPWFERFKCPECGFSKENVCSGCGGNNLSVAYPTEELVEVSFPKMMADLSPGCTVLATNGTGEVVGLNNAGMDKMQTLMERKYKPEVAFAIYDEANLTSDQWVWFENESAVRPAYQKNGIGSKMSKMRNEVMIQVAPDIVCGRSINPYWLKKREEHLTAAGYTYNRFIPSTETFEVNGKRRNFYFATKD